MKHADYYIQQSTNPGYSAFAHKETANAFLGGSDSFFAGSGLSMLNAELLEKGYTEGIIPGYGKKNTE
jgi:hypothetical protein